MGGLVTFIVLLIIGVIFGRANEANHLRRLRADEAAMSHIKVLNIKTLPSELEPGGKLVMGSVVIAVDYFKIVMSSIRMVFGGRLNSYETLLDRARREAIIRMQKDADRLGADAVYNARVEFSAIGQQPARIGGAELLAYGTAIKLSSETISNESNLYV